MLVTIPGKLSRSDQQPVETAAAFGIFKSMLFQCEWYLIEE